MVTDRIDKVIDNCKVGIKITHGSPSTNFVKTPGSFRLSPVDNETR